MEVTRPFETPTPRPDETIKLVLKGIDVSSLVNYIGNHPELFGENTWRQNYVVKLERPVSPQQDTRAIMFRWAPENTIESVRDSLDIIQHDNFNDIQEFKNLYVTCLAAIGAVECGRAFITELKVGGKILPHCDYGMYSDHFERFHLVLTSQPGNEFFVQDSKGNISSRHMKPGELYWFNHKDTHWVHNDSNSPRMHLIIDAVAPNFRRERVTV